MMPEKKAYTINPYATGNKIYGLGRNNPTSGPVDPVGYRERDARNARRNALLRYLKAGQKNKYMSSDWLGQG